MATATLLGALAPPVADSTAATTSPKTVQQLLHEIDEVKKDVESAKKRLEKIDTNRKKVEANREQAKQGRTEIRDLKERVMSLHKQIDDMKKETDPSWVAASFDTTKKNAIKTLGNLSNKLHETDKRLEKVTGPVVITEAPVTDTQSTVTPAVPAAEENSRGLGSLIGKLPFGGKKKSASNESLASSTPLVPATPKSEKETDHKTTTDQAAHDDESGEGEESIDDDNDDDDVVSEKKTESKQPSPSTKVTQTIITNQKKLEVDNVESDEDSEDDEDYDADDADDNRRLLTELENRHSTDPSTKDPNSGRRSRSPATPRTTKKAPLVKIESSSKPRKTITTSPIPPPPSIRKKTPSPRRRPEPPITKKTRVEESEEDSYFEEDEDDDDDEHELRGLRNTGDHEEVESDHVYDDQEEDEPTVVNAHVQQLRTTKYSPGTQFLVTHDLTSVQTGDLTIHKGETITLVEQRPDDWWLFKNVQTQQQGVVPINHVQLLSGNLPRRRAKPSTSATTLVDAFKANNNIPVGFIPSDLAPLTQLEEYQLWRAFVPKMTESNLAFTDLYWRADVDKIHVHAVNYQKILTLKECVKIPRIKGEQIRVLNRCVRVCLYDGFEIVSNIHTVQAIIPKKLDERDLTEDWQFASSDFNTLIDEQPQLLIRANQSKSDQHLNLLIELSQWCQSTVTQEKCEIGCGWSIIPFNNEHHPLITDTKSYNEILNGGHTDETNVLLDPQYKILRVDGLSGKIDRLKRARIKFSLESREDDIDLLFDNLPIQSTVVPLNLIKSLVFFRNELAYQLHKRHHPTGLSTTPMSSIFLSTFFQTLQQPDLIYNLRRLYRTRRKRNLNSSASVQQQREEYIKTYEIFIYPLLHYRQLPPYDFHDTTVLNERKKLITDMIKRQLPAKKTKPQDILSILLDPNLTDKWTPFTTDEICFSLQKYIHDFQPDVVA